jgi:hypothetical protein
MVAEYCSSENVTNYGIPKLLYYDHRSMFGGRKLNPHNNGNLDVPVERKVLIVTINSDGR